MYRRKASKALTHVDVRELADATNFADKRGKPLTTTLTIHPAYLETYPADIGGWLTTFLNKLRIWCGRAGFGYFAIWVRENYEGHRKEHLHVLLYVPEGKRHALEMVLRQWLPGQDAVLSVGRPTFRFGRSGRRVNKALTYMLKQMTPQAWVALGKQVPRERRCRRTGDAIALVMGKRCGVSRSLNLQTRRRFWDSPAKAFVTGIASASHVTKKAA